MCCSSSESDGKTICLAWIDHSISSRHPCGEREGSLPREMLLIMVLTVLNVFSTKGERSLNNKSLQQRKCREFQTNETSNYSESKWHQSRNETRPLTLLWYFKYVKGKISTEATSWHPWHMRTKPGSRMPPTYPARPGTTLHMWCWWCFIQLILKFRFDFKFLGFSSIFSIFLFAFF